MPRCRSASQIEEKCNTAPPTCLNSEVLPFQVPTRYRGQITLSSQYRKLNPAGTEETYLPRSHYTSLREGFRASHF